MISLQDLIAQTIKTNKQSKTIVFAIKMFGYATQTITQKETIYPMEISIPIDSRIKTIYKKQFPQTNHSDLKIREYFDQLSLKNNIPPLHLDSILRLDYWNKIVNK
jgi:DNA-(apurinic or apyrimidinic site) lyase